MHAFHAAFLRDSLWISLASFALAAVAYFWVPHNDGLKIALLFGCLSAPASALIRMNGSIANSVRRYALSYVPDFLYRPGLLLAYLIFAWAVGFHLSIAHVLWAFVIMNTIVALAQAWLIGEDRSSGSNGRAQHLAPFCAAGLRARYCWLFILPWPMLSPSRRLLLNNATSPSWVSTCWPRWLVSTRQPSTILRLAAP